MNIGNKPQLLIAELELIGNVMSKPELFDEIRSWPLEAFEGAQARWVFGKYKEASQAKQTLPSPGMLVEMGLREKVKDAEKILEAWTMAFVPSLVPYYFPRLCNEIREVYVLRKLREHGLKMTSKWSPGMAAQDVFDPTRETLDKLEAFLASEDSSGVREIAESIRFELASEHGSRGAWKSKVGDWDLGTGGYLTGLYVFGARPEVGKTAWALTAANAAAKQGIEVLFFSLDQTKQDIVNRLIGMNAKIDAALIRTAALSAEQVARYAEQLPECIEIVGKRVSTKEMHRIAKAWRRERKGKVVICIDYLEKLKSDYRGNNREQAVAEMSSACKDLVKECNATVILLSQLSRDAEGTEPQTTHLRYSGMIEQDADVLAFLWPEKGTETPSEMSCNCKVTKNKLTGTKPRFKYKLKKATSKCYTEAVSDEFPF